MNRHISLCLASALAAALSTHAYAEDDIKVGMVIATSGWHAPYDYAYRTAEMAVDDINAKGGLLGRKLSVKVLDTKSDAIESAKVGAELAAEAPDVAIISCDYDTGAPAALSTTAAGIISISMCSGEPKFGIKGLGSLAFTAGTAGQSQGAVNAQWAYDVKGYRKAYVLTDTQIEYTKSVCEGFNWEWGQLKDTKVSGSDTFKNQDASIAAQISNLKSASEKPDFIMLCSFMPGAASALRQIRAAGIDLPIFMPSGSDGSYWMAGVPNLSNVFVPSGAMLNGKDPNPKVNDIVKRYEEKYGETPTTAYVLFGYSAIELWAKAVEKAGATDSAAVRKVLESFSSEPFLVGKYTFTDKLHIQNEATFQMLGIENGTYKSFGYVTSPSLKDGML